MQASIRKPRSYFDSLKRQRNFFTNLAKELNINSADAEDWYSVGNDLLDEIRRRGGDFVVKEYNGKPFDALKSVFPEINFDSSRNPFYLSRKKSEFWNSTQNCREFLTWIQKYVLNLKTDEINYEEWYNMDPLLIKKYGGATLLSRYNGDLFKLFKSIFPEYDWKIWRFTYLQLPQGWWNDLTNQRLFMEELGKQFGFKRKEDFYSLTSQMIVNYGGGHLINKFYNGSPYAVVKAIFHEEKWSHWKFSQVPRGFWEKRENVLEAFNDISTDICSDLFPLEKNPSPEKILHVWKEIQIPLAQFINKGGACLIRVFGSIYNLLSFVYPGEIFPYHKQQIEGEREMRAPKMQTYLFNCVQSAFPNINEIFMNYPIDKFSSQLKDSSGQSLELDIYIPSLKLAFEYQGMQHYSQVNWGDINVKIQKERDQRKQAICKEKEITLIYVPYYFDLSTPSLTQLILDHRPDIKEFSKS